MTSDLGILRHVAIEAGTLALRIRKKGLKIKNKPGGSPVSNGDLEANRVIREFLRAARPDYGWLSEEDPDTPERLTKKRVFVIDPIDGTSAYIKDREFWSVSVAVVEDGKAISGVVYAPSLDQMYDAEAGKGATLNGKPIRVSGCSDEAGCTMLGAKAMFDHDSWQPPWPPMRVEQRNSIAYRMCIVASGEFDACLAPSMKHDWDLAAGDVIMREAGGLATDHKGQAFVYNKPTPTQVALVCAGPALHARLIERVNHIELPYRTAPHD
jgi:myo-inositol-1(or 4)-monophosphatase